MYVQEKNPTQKKKKREQERDEHDDDDDEEGCGSCVVAGFC